MAKDSQNLSSKELLIRIDERQQQIISEIKDLRNKSEKYVTRREFQDHIQNSDERIKTVNITRDEFDNIESKVNTLWDKFNQGLGWLAGAAAVGGVTGGLAAKAFSMLGL